MRAFLSMCVVAACLAVSCSASWKEEFKARAKLCSQEVGATPADAAELNDRTKPPASSGAKKILACAMKKDKLIVGGKFSPEGLSEFLHQATEGKPGAEKHVEKAKEVAGKCNTELTEKAPASDEDLAVSIRECLVKTWKEAGSDFADELEFS